MNYSSMCFYQNLVVYINNSYMKYLLAIKIIHVHIETNRYIYLPLHIT
jgi:hypothetical protein